MESVNRQMPSIVGQVTDSITGKPISGVQVAVLGVPAYRTTTDSQGNYRLDNVAPSYPPGAGVKPYTLYFTHLNYNSNSVIVVVPATVGTVRADCRLLAHIYPPTPTPTPTAPEEYLAHIPFLRMSWANELQLRSFAQTKLVSTVNSFLPPGYRAVEGGLSGSSEFYCRVQKTGSPFAAFLIPLLPLIIKALVAAALIIGAVLVAWFWTETVKGQTQVQGRGQTTAREVVDTCTAAYQKGDINHAQYLECVREAQGIIAETAKQQPAPWTWPTLENLTPIIIVVLIVAVAVVAVSWLRK